MNVNFSAGFFMVPSVVCDRYLKQADEKQIKVLLLVLRHASDGIDPAEIARRLGLSENVVNDCLKFWVDGGVLSIDGSDFKETPVPETPEKAKTKMYTQDVSTPGQKVLITSSRNSLSQGKLNELAAKDKDWPVLLEEMQKIYGKTISRSDNAVLGNLYFNFIHDIPYLLMAAQYMTDKKNMALTGLETFIADLLEKEIDTTNRLEIFLNRIREKSENEKTVRNIFGIYDRKLSEKESACINDWIAEMKMPTELIQLAYDQTIDKLAKVNFTYTDKILKTWYQHQIKTVEEANAYMARQADKRRSSPSYTAQTITDILNRKNKGG